MKWWRLLPVLQHKKKATLRFPNYHLMTKKIYLTRHLINQPRTKNKCVLKKLRRMCLNKNELMYKDFYIFLFLFKKRGKEWNTSTAYCPFSSWNPVHKAYVYTLQTLNGCIANVHCTTLYYVFVLYFHLHKTEIFVH